MRITNKKSDIIGNHDDSRSLPSTVRRRRLTVFAIALILFLVVFVVAPGSSRLPTLIPSSLVRAISSEGSSSNNNKYLGKQYWKDGITLDVKTIYESKFARFQIHKVLLEDGKTVVDDWLWYDEQDQINVLVEDINGNYVVFYQSKYGIETPTYAIVGGLIEVNENPLDAAKRELKEEVNMVSTEWIELGSYRAAANRGGGRTYTYLARHATTIIQKENGNIVESSKRTDSVPVPVVGELERQDIIKLTREELIEYLLDGKFQEIKWTATIALALLKTSTIT